MCVIDWNSTCGRPIECSRRGSTVRGVPSTPASSIARALLDRHHAPLAGRVEHALLDERVAAVEQADGGLVAGVVVLGPQRVEEPVRAALGLGAEQLRELAGGLGALGLLLGDRLGVDDG